jgi:hypothetical protein
MATKQTTKKTPVKKTATKSAASTAKKKTTARKASTAAKKNAEMKSFRVYKSDVPFTNTKPTRQTAYWIVILGVITVAQLIILKIQLDIFEITQPLIM